MTENVICPFSKPIIGNWCQCQYANLAERCSGKMGCKQTASLLPVCNQLVDLLKENSRFVLGLSDEHAVLTHAQLMKIRCGGMQGMHRLFGCSSEIPDIQEIMTLLHQQYSEMSDFPYTEIMPDIKSFRHRVSKHE